MNTVSLPPRSPSFHYTQPWTTSRHYPRRASYKKVRFTPSTKSSSPGSPGPTLRGGASPRSHPGRPRSRVDFASKRSQKYLAPSLLHPSRAASPTPLPGTHSHSQTTPTIADFARRIQKQVYRADNEPPQGLDGKARVGEGVNVYGTGTAATPRRSHRALSMPARLDNIPVLHAEDKVALGQHPAPVAYTSSTSSRSSDTSSTLYSPYVPPKQFLEPSIGSHPYRATITDNGHKLPSEFLTVYRLTMLLNLSFQVYQFRFARFISLALTLLGISN